MEEEEEGVNDESDSEDLAQLLGKSEHDDIDEMQRFREKKKQIKWKKNPKSKKAKK